MAVTKTVTTEKFRNITEDETAQLERQGCTCDNWQSISVAKNFSPKYIVDVSFSGSVKLGCFDKTFEQEGGVSLHSGIFHAILHNCEIMDNTYISHVGVCIANYKIGKDCVIENIGQLVVTGKTTFGNGVIVSPINEGGGREVPICDELSSQSAYLLACYRHRPQMVDNLQRMIHSYAESLASETGEIGDNVTIRNCVCIKNVRIGSNATIENCTELRDGSINSNSTAPTHIGVGVVAHDFVVSSGCAITEYALIDRCFIGQSCQIGKQYSATDTLFFANCQGFHGEAASVFAGPFTVSHHKSSLLIAGIFSFLNVGSGSNQSNHAYKLGPVHQGIVERGSKTASGSHLLWPAKIGAFSLIMGKHATHPDTSSLPFSYLIESGGETDLVPAVNLRSAGTFRDARKWENRDGRKDPHLLDQINFNLLSPYTVQKMVDGISLLKELKQNAPTETSSYYYYNVCIKESARKKGIELYQKAIDKFLGDALIKRLGNTDFNNSDQIKKILLSESDMGSGEWVDLSGQLLPKDKVTDIIQKIEDGTYKNIQDVNHAFEEAFINYDLYEWAWASKEIEKEMGEKIENFTSTQFLTILERWKEACFSFNKLLYKDAKKEFMPTVKISFGIDGDEEERGKDFEAVRGNLESNQFVKNVQKNIQEDEDLARNLIERIEKSFR